MPLASQSPYPIIVYSVANYRPHLSHFWANMYFHAPSLVTFYFYELTHFLDGMKNTLLFVTNILVHLLTVNMKNCLNPPKSENVRPHYSQSSRENVTPSSRTSLLACYKEVPPSPGHDSRPKRAKSVPVFKLKRRKNPIVGAAHTFMTYIREYPHHHPPPSARHPRGRLSILFVHCNANNHTPSYA